MPDRRAARSHRHELRRARRRKNLRLARQAREQKRKRLARRARRRRSAPAAAAWLLGSFLLEDRRDRT